MPRYRRKTSSAEDADTQGWNELSLCNIEKVTTTGVEWIKGAMGWEEIT